MDVKNTISSVRNKLVSKYLLNDNYDKQTKSTNINVLLNRVKLDQKKESRKKLLLTAATSASVLLFSVLIF